MSIQNLSHISEPLLEFDHAQKEEHPKDGLFLYGPPNPSMKGSTIRYGVIGTKAGIEKFEKWADIINGYIPPYKEDVAHHAPFPGFESAFGLKWTPTPLALLQISGKQIADSLRLTNRHEAIKKTVEIFSTAILEHRRTNEEIIVDFWYVIIPDEVYEYGRPQKAPPVSERIQGSAKLPKRTAEKFLEAPSMFSEDNEEAELQRYALNFHNQLKARLLSQAVVQIIKENTLHEACDLKLEIKKRKTQDPATLAWNLCTTSYYKSAGPPWRLADIRPGVCYVGIVFKQDTSDRRKSNACCGAQLFLKSGEGLVFKGTTGAWYSDELMEYHLDKYRARELMSMVIEGYKSLNDGAPPKEIFIHAQSRFNEEEWNGFQSALADGTKLTGIRIQSTDQLKLYRLAKQPPIRGTYYQTHDRGAYLWTKGYVARYNTYPGFEVPNPLLISIDWGEAEMREVLSDILALTKVNFNGCTFADGIPVTLKFAHAIGEILTAAPDIEDGAPQPFKYYI